MTKSEQLVKLRQRLMPDPTCTCDQHGDYCPAHPTCACGCQRHAHRTNTYECIAGKMNCHGCDVYRPAKLKRFHELDDDAIEQASLVELRLAYRDLRAHHIEETVALWTRWFDAKSDNEKG